MNNVTNFDKPYDSSACFRPNLRFAKTNLGPYIVSTICKKICNKKMFETIIQSTAPQAADKRLDNYIAICETEKLAQTQHADAVNYVQNFIREYL